MGCSRRFDFESYVQDLRGVAIGEVSAIKAFSGFLHLESCDSHRDEFSRYLCDERLISNEELRMIADGEKIVQGYVDLSRANMNPSRSGVIFCGGVYEV